MFGEILSIDCPAVQSGRESDLLNGSLNWSKSPLSSGRRDGGALQLAITDQDGDLAKRERSSLFCSPMIN
jgi:hypothetical protein